MRSFIFFLIILSTSLTLYAQEIGDQKCVTHTVTNETSGTTSTITRCADTGGEENAKDDVDTNGAVVETTQSEFSDWEINNSFDDLAAQRSMARSTEWLVIWTFFGLIVSAVALGLLYYTIQQNKQTLDHIKNTSFLELKPYLKVEFAGPISVLEKSHLVGNQEHFHIRIKIINVGKTPAKNVMCIINSGDTRIIYTHAEEASVTACFSCLEENMEDCQTYLAAGEHIEFNLFGGWEAMYEDWNSDFRFASSSASRNEWRNTEVSLPRVDVRYKDLECESSDYHKLETWKIKYTLNILNLPTTKLSVLKVGTDKDLNYGAYFSYVQ